MCIPFEELPDGTIYENGQVMPGDQLLDHDGVKVIFNTYTNSAGDAQFGGVEATSNSSSISFNAADSIHLRLASVSLDFDFTELSVPPTIVAIDFKMTADPLNIRVNDSPTLVLRSINSNSLPTSLGGVSMNVKLTSATEGRLELQGNMIDFVKIGGESMAIDNACYGYNGEVWPGDTNEDNVVNNKDFLSVVTAYGTTGATRNIQGNSWLPLQSAEWFQTFPNGVNFNNADCNGDGFIDYDDLEAIQENYERSHDQISPQEEVEGDSLLSPPLFVNTFNPNAPGNINNGYAYEVEFDPFAMPIEAGSDPMDGGCSSR